jgi:ribulose-5-phosphate 4-epimerase/fuculose-1-phosphate aldolase
MIIRAATHGVITSNINSDEAMNLIRALDREIRCATEWRKQSLQKLRDQLSNAVTLAESTEAAR